MPHNESDISIEDQPFVSKGWLLGILIVSTFTLIGIVYHITVDSLHSADAQAQTAITALQAQNQFILKQHSIIGANMFYICQALKTKCETMPEN